MYVTDDPFATRFDISFPVSELTVDEPAMRERRALTFRPAFRRARARERARTCCRRRCSTARIIRRSGCAPPTSARRARTYDVGVEITLKGTSCPLRVPVTVKRQDGAIIASGEFPLKQSELGLKPFSVAMGALVVLDEMRIRFDVVARQ